MLVVRRKVGGDGGRSLVVMEEDRWLWSEVVLGRRGLHGWNGQMEARATMREQEAYKYEKTTDHGVYKQNNFWVW